MKPKNIIVCDSESYARHLLDFSVIFLVGGNMKSVMHDMTPQELYDDIVNKRASQNAMERIAFLHSYSLDYDALMLIETFSHYFPKKLISYSCIIALDQKASAYFKLRFSEN